MFVRIEHGLFFPDTCVVLIIGGDISSSLSQGKRMTSGMLTFLIGHLHYRDPAARLESQEETMAVPRDTYCIGVLSPKIYFKRKA